MAALAFGGLGLFLFFAPFALFFVQLDGFIGDLARLDEVRPQFLHLCADFVYFDQLFGREQSQTDHAPVYQRGALVGDGWNEIAPTKPWIPKERPHLEARAAADLVAR